MYVNCEGCNSLPCHLIKNKKNRGDENFILSKQKSKTIIILKFAQLIKINYLLNIYDI